MRTLIEKELRENLRWLFVGLAMIVPLLWYATPKSLADEIRHTENSIATMMFFGASAFAIGLGVMQSFADLRTANRSFLFHRSVSVSTIFYSKLMVGATIYFAAVGLPLLAVAIWFSWQGIDNLPVRPIQVFPATVVALACFGFHPAAMLMLARSGRWFGTKLLPLFFVLPLILLGLTTLNTLMNGLAVNTLIIGSILIGILTLVEAAKHAWVYSVANEGNYPRRPASIASILTITSAAVFLQSLCLVFISGLVVSNLQSDTSNIKVDYAMDVDGNAWWAKSSRSRNDHMQTFIEGDRLQKDEFPDPRRKLPENSKLRDLSQVFQLRKPASCFEGENRWVGGDRQSYFDSRGNVLLYDRTQRPPLQAIVSRDGKPFAGDPRSRLASAFIGSSEDQMPVLWIDREGIYRFSGSSDEVKTLIELPIEAVTMEARSTITGDKYNILIQLTVLSDGKLHLLRITGEDGSDWVRPTPKSADGVSGFGIKEIAVTPPLPRTAVNALRFGVVNDTKFTVVLDGQRPSFWTYNSDSDTSWNSTPFRKPSTEKTVERGYPLVFSFLPGLASIIVFVVIVIGNLMKVEGFPSIDEIQYAIQDNYAFVVIGFVIMILSMIATSYACRRRMLSRSQTIRWCCWTVLLGCATPLAVLAIYTRPTCTRCKRCEKQRRIDRRICEHCGSDWERAERKSIEIFDEGYSSDTMLEVGVRQSSVES